MIKAIVCPFGDLNLLVSLCEALQRQSPDVYDFTYLSFTEYDRAVYRTLGTKHQHIAPGVADTCELSARELEDVIEFSRKLQLLHWGQPDTEHLLATARHYANRIARLIDDDGYNSALFFNGRMNLVISALATVAQRRRLDCLVFEQGLFRPGYLTVDGRGVNFRNSVDSVEQLLGAQPFPYQERPLFHAIVEQLGGTLNAVTDYKRAVPKLQLLVAYLKMKVAGRRQIQLLTAEGRDLAEASLWSPRQPAMALQDFHQVVASSKYDHVILCPLQVQTDTQVLLYSPLIEDMQVLVRTVTAAVDRYNQEQSTRACVFFKTHPQDRRGLQTAHPDAYLISEPAVGTLFETRCDLVVTVNSTVGIEAIAAGIPVITLGDAFYNLPGIVAGHCNDLTELPALIRQALTGVNEPDRVLQERFVRCLKEKYQVRFSVT